MTEQATETTMAETSNEDTEAQAPGTTEAEENEQEATEGRKGNPEAAKWRTKFRDAETQIATLTQRVVDLQHAEVVRLASGPGLLVDGDDVFRTSQLADLLDEDGNVDADLVGAAVTAVREAKPHLASPAFGDGVGLGERGPVAEATWADVLRG